MLSPIRDQSQYVQRGSLIPPLVSLGTGIGSKSAPSANIRPPKVFTGGFSNGRITRRLQKLLALNRVQPTVAMPLPEVACACMLYHISQCFRAGGREKSIAGDAFGRGAPSTATRVQTPDVIVADFIKVYCDAETVRVASLSSASFSMVICTRISP